MNQTHTENEYDDLFSLPNLTGMTVAPEFGLEGGEEILQKVLQAKIDHWNPTYERYYKKNYKARVAMRRGRSGRCGKRRPEDVAHEDARRIATKFGDDDPKYQEALRQIEREYGAVFIPTGTTI